MMCNEAARRASLSLIRDDFSQVGIPLRFPEGLPNLQSLDSIRITDPAVIARAATDGAEMVQRRWSWGGPPSKTGAGKPVYNYRSEGREFRNSGTGGRCLIPLDGFYEFTDPAAEPDLLPGAKAKARKDKWLFTLGDPPAGVFCVAGLWRTDAKVGEAFTMLTCEPGPDIAPYHSRQIVLMPRERWAAWLDDAHPAATLIVPTPAGTLRVEKAVRR